MYKEQWVSLCKLGLPPDERIKIAHYLKFEEFENKMTNNPPPTSSSPIPTPRRRTSPAA